MKIAYLIAAHEHPELLARLVRRLESPLSSIFIHVDINSDIRPFHGEFVRQCIHSIHWVPRVKSTWGAFGQVKASLSLLKFALATDQEAEMFVFISGQDYPLQTPESMVTFFESKKGISFIKWARLPWSIWSDNGGFERLTHYHFSIGKGREKFEHPCPSPPGGRRWKLFSSLCSAILTIPRHLPEDIQFYGGYSWWNLTRQASDSIFEYLKQNPAFTKIFRFSRSSDEIFFQTILMNLKMQVPLENNDLRCVFWDNRRDEYPAIITEDELSEICASNMLFARKVHPQRSIPLLNKIDNFVLTRS